MKRCPECRRDYHDDSLLYCLDDGTALLDGPASGDEPATAILTSESATRIHGTQDALPGSTSTAVENAGSNRKLLIAAVLGVLVVAAIGIGAYWFVGNKTSKQIDSIAVMPFSNESGNPEMEYLSDGMTETLIGSLQQIPNLNVKARSSVFRYKGKETDAQTIGRELNVQAILNGRVVQRGQALTLYVELVDARTENSLWTQSYNKAMTDLVSLQNDIARDVAERLRLRLSGEDEKRLAKNYTANAEAYRLYLLGRSYWNKRGRENIEKSIDYFQQAIGIDPNFALAFAGLAEAYAQPSQQPAGMAKARLAAQKALSLDDGLAEAHTALARVLAYHDYDFSGAERELQRAMDLDPGFAQAHARYGALLMNLGKFEAAEPKYRRALELEPLSLDFNTGYGSMLANARRYDEAIAQLKKTLEFDQNVFLAHGALSTAYQLKGDYPDCVEERARVFEVNGDPQSAASVRESFAKSGWEGFLRYMTTRGGNEFGTAPFYAALGEKDEAFAALNEAFEKRSSWLVGIKVSPLLDPLRDDPRFAELLKKVGFPE
jgi:eukaryotic-like serine/threonine-protein kinase